MLSHFASLVEQDAWDHTWEDEDDGESQPQAPAPVFQVEAGASVPSSGLRQLVVALYGAGSVFASCAWADRLQAPPLARVLLPPASESGKSEELATVHRLDDATLLVLGVKAVPADQAFGFARLLAQHLPLPGAEATLILHSLSRHEYLHAGARESTATLRLLETQAARARREGGAPVACPYLEVPNMVEGAAAALLSHLERRGQVGRLVVSVLGEEPGGRLGVEAVQGFATVLAADSSLLGPSAAPLPQLDVQRTQAATKAFNARLSLPKTSIFL